MNIELYPPVERINPTLKPHGIYSDFWNIIFYPQAFYSYELTRRKFTHSYTDHKK